MIKRFFKRMFAKPGLSREPVGHKQAGISHDQSRVASYHVNKPVIWGHKDHQIDRRLLSHHAIRVCETLQDRGFKAFIVGGAVRDLLLGMQPKDFDVATNAKPEEVRRAFRRARIIGKRFQIVHVMFGPETIETSTFRALSNPGAEMDEHGRVLRDNVFGKQDEDATRRDFSVNAMYYDPKTETVWDYHRGMEDLRSRVLRMIGDPASRYREDPVRMLRAVRFSAKLGFEIEASTKSPIRELGGLISNVPAARLFDEMLKLLSSGKASACLHGLRDAGLHQGVFPLLDDILDDESGTQFVEEALRRTDTRVREGKPLSSGFLFACLLWHMVLRKWNSKLNQSDVAKFPALFEAIDEVLAEQYDRTAIPRRITGDMREIWAFQPRFERRAGKQPFRMIEQPKFRAALDFFELRAHTGDADQELAQWWRSFYENQGNDRQAMLDALRGQPGTAQPKRRKRRKPRRSTPSAGNNSTSPDTQAGEDN